jgi:MoaA/NifB/PqqE/SkfB family radical SAM enzyme
MDRLAVRGAFFGTSMALTCRNFERATDEAHLRRLIARGCRLFYFINYVPVAPGTDDLQLEEAQVAELERRLAHYRRTLGALFIAFPHDEMALGGCLAAGRGFVHINAYGAVEPCPFSPYSDSDLTEMSFEQALASELFRTLRDSGKLDEADGRCALWKKREWVAGLVKNQPR